MAIYRRKKCSFADLMKCPYNTGAIEHLNNTIDVPRSWGSFFYCHRCNKLHWKALNKIYVRLGRLLFRLITTTGYNDAYVLSMPMSQFLRSLHSGTLTGSPQREVEWRRTKPGYNSQLITSSSFYISVLHSTILQLCWSTCVQGDNIHRSKFAVFLHNECHVGFISFRKKVSNIQVMIQDPVQFHLI